MTSPLKHLLPHHQRIMELALEGLPRREIAAIVDMTPQQITNILNSPLFQDEIARRREDRNKEQDKVSASALVEAKQKLELASAQAVAVLESHLSHQDARIQQSAARDILDRVLRKDGTGVSQSIVLNVDQIQILVTALKESQSD